MTIFHATKTRIDTYLAQGTQVIAECNLQNDSSTCKHTNNGISFYRDATIQQISLAEACPPDYTKRRLESPSLFNHRDAKHLYGHMQDEPVCFTFKGPISSGAICIGMFQTQSNISSDGVYRASKTMANLYQFRCENRTDHRQKEQPGFAQVSFRRSPYQDKLATFVVADFDHNGSIDLAITGAYGHTQVFMSNHQWEDVCLDDVRLCATF